MFLLSAIILKNLTGGFEMELDSKKIREQIKELGLTIGQAAKLMGRSRAGLHMLLLNRSAKLWDIEEIANPIGLCAKDILISNDKFDLAVEQAV
jgi:hypothetical protein